MNMPFLIRNLPKEKRNELLLIKKISELKEDLDFYKSIFQTHQNSVIFNLTIKTINGKKIWIDKVTETCDRNNILILDQDDETKEWLKPIRCER